MESPAAVAVEPRLEMRTARSSRGWPQTRERWISTHDAIVVGGGHNGLACAVYLARAGWAWGATSSGTDSATSSRTSPIAAFDVSIDAQALSVRKGGTSASFAGNLRESSSINYLLRFTGLSQPLWYFYGIACRLNQQ